jgi:elongation factor 1-beta
MGIALIKIKLMPVSPDTNLEEIKEKAKDVIGNNKGKNIHFEEEPIAFGLKAVITSFGIDENDELEPIEKNLREIKNISSAEVIDMRRAFG